MFVGRWSAGLASALLPGIGHVAWGRRWRGVGFVAAAIAVPWTIPWTVRAAYLLALVLAVLAVLDLLVLVRVRRERAGASRDVLIVGAAGVLAAALGWATYDVLKAPSSSMEPTVATGSHFAVNRLAYTLGEPALGDVVVFDHPCEPSKLFFKRIVALGGDTVEVRCGVLYVDGEAVPRTMVAAEATYRDRDGDFGGWEVRHASRYRERLGGHTYDVLHPASYPQEEQQPDDRDFPQLSEHERQEPGCRMAEPVGEIVYPPYDGPPRVCEPQAHYVVPKGHAFVLGDNRSNSSDSRVWGPVRVDLIRGRLAGVE